MRELPHHYGWVGQYMKSQPNGNALNQPRGCIKRNLTFWVQGTSASARSRSAQGVGHSERMNAWPEMTLMPGTD